MRVVDDGLRRVRVVERVRAGCHHAVLQRDAADLLDGVCGRRCVGREGRGCCGDLCSVVVVDHAVDFLRHEVGLLALLRCVRWGCLSVGLLLG